MIGALLLTLPEVAKGYARQKRPNDDLLLDDEDIILFAVMMMFYG